MPITGLGQLVGMAPAATAPAMASINETGRVLAQLDDVRAIFFVLVVVIVLLLGVVLWMMRTLIGNLTAVVKQLAASIDGMTKASADRTTAELIHNARVESVLVRVDAELSRRDRDRGDA